MNTCEFKSPLVSVDNPENYYYIRQCSIIAHNLQPQAIPGNKPGMLKKNRLFTAYSPNSSLILPISVKEFTIHGV